MKFHQLRPGARFRLRGAIYRKVSPLKAASEADDSQRLVPRSAEVALLDDAGTALVETLPENLSRASVEAALDALLAACRRGAERTDPPLSETQLTQLEQAFEAARTDILAGLAMQR